MRRWIEIWQLISDFGCQSTSTFSERKHIRLANQSAIVLTLLILLYAVVFGLFGPAPLGWITWGVALFFAAIPWLQKRTAGAVGVRYYFLLISYASIFVYSVLVGRESGIHLFFISAIATPFLVLDLHYKRSVFLFCIIPIALLLTLELFLYDMISPLPFSSRAQRMIYIMMLPSAALTTFLYSGYFYLINQVHENELHLTIQDVNRSKKLIEDQQLQLASASRLSAIGELSGSIAHEINNPLSIILGYTELIMRLMRMETIDRERILQNCEKILKTINRISKIVLGLRKLSREGSDDPPENSNLKDVIDDAMSVCVESLAHLGIEMRLHLPDEPIYCYCRPLQISQVLLNLIQNAKEAIQELDSKWIEIDVQVQDKDFVIQVKDSGIIRDPVILEKIGQPFFTTKPPGKGTGLGLSISRKILSAHGGSIEIDKEASSTTFIVKLPRKVQTS